MTSPLPPADEFVKPTTNRESIPAVLVADADAGRAHGPGAYWFDDERRVLQGILPGGHGFSCPYEGPGAWNWDGNRESPTLTPSILVNIIWGEEEELIELWHGYLTAGQFVSV